MTSSRARTSKRRPIRVAIVVSRYNASITDRLLEGAMTEYERRSPGAARAEVLDAPGSFELPAIALAAARSGRFDGVVALGCLIKGETRHDEYIAHAVSNGLIGVTLQTGVPVGFGVLTVDSPEQAAARAGGEHGNKGQDAMGAVIDTVAVMRSVGGRGGGNPHVSTRRDKAAGVRGGGGR